MPENVLNGHHIDVKNKSCDVQDNDGVNVENEIHFEPIVSLPLVEISNNEEDEIEMIKLRAKLYRYDSVSNPPEWKERGTGEVKLLRHKMKSTVRVVMRRDKTLKICANHFVTPWMELKPNCGSDRAWVWSVLADFADEQLKPELLAIRFANAENAALWKEAFEKAKVIVGSECEIYAGKTNPEDKHTESESESSSDVSCSEATDNEEQSKADKENGEIKSVKQSNVGKETTKNSIEEVKVIESADEVVKGLQSLEMCDNSTTKH